VTDVNDNNGFEDGPAARPAGRILAIDLGRKRVGLAVSDEMRLSARRLPVLPRSNWKDLLRALSEIVREFDVREVVFGLPLLLEGGEGDAAAEARRIGRNLQLSLKLPVRFQDERLTSKAAEESLRADGHAEPEIPKLVDGEAARLILLDFLSRREP
jgi:putative Holliday junction resolvase